MCCSGAGRSDGRSEPAEVPRRVREAAQGAAEDARQREAADAEVPGTQRRNRRQLRQSLDRVEAVAGRPGNHQQPEKGRYYPM